MDTLIIFRDIDGQEQAKRLVFEDVVNDLRLVENTPIVWDKKNYTIEGITIGTIQSGTKKVNMVFLGPITH